MSGLNPEERVLSDKPEFIRYCGKCFAMEYQPHCSVCDVKGYPFKISVDDFDDIGVLLDSYYSCLLKTAEKKAP